MEVKERVIDLKEYFIYLWERKLLILLVTVICAGGLLVYGYNKNKAYTMNANSTTSPATISALVEKNYAAAHNTGEESIPNAFSELPYGAYKVQKYLYIDFDYDVLGDMEISDYPAVLSRFQGDVNFIFKSDSSIETVIEKLELNNYADMKDIDRDDLKLIISGSFTSTNIFQVVVLDVDVERAGKIADALIEELKNKSSDYPSIKEISSFDSLNTVIGQTEDGTADKIENNLGNQSFVIKKAIKYGVVGAALGFAMMMAMCFIVFVFKDAVRTSCDIEFAGVKTYGVIPHKNKDEYIRKLAFSLSRLEKGSVISVIPVDRYSEDFDFINLLSEGIVSFDKKISVFKKEEIFDVICTKKSSKSISDKDIIILASRNINDNVEGDIAAANCNMVILAVKHGKTRMKDYVCAVDSVKKSQGNISGLMIY